MRTVRRFNKSYADFDTKRVPMEVGTLFCLGGHKLFILLIQQVSGEEEDEAGGGGYVEAVSSQVVGA